MKNHSRKKGKVGTPKSKGTETELPSPDLVKKYDDYVFRYMKHLNQSRAVRETGHWRESNADQQGSVLMKVPYVRQQIERQMAAMKARHEVSLQRLIEEIERCAISNMADYVVIDPVSGGAYVDLRHVDVSHLAAVKEIVTEHYTEGKGDDAPTVKKVTLKLVDKAKFIEILGSAKKFPGFVRKDEEQDPSKPTQLPVLNIIIREPYKNDKP